MLLARSRGCARNINLKNTEVFMHVLISILIIVALVFGVVFFIPNGCFDSNVSQGDDTTLGDGSADSDVNITTATVDIDIVNGDGVSLKGKVMEFIGRIIKPRYKPVPQKKALSDPYVWNIAVDSSKIQALPEQTKPKKKNKGGIER